MDQNQIRYFAIMDGNTVINMVWAYSKEEVESSIAAHCIEYTMDNPAHLGLTYDPATGLFEQLSIPAE